MTNNPADGDRDPDKGRPIPPAHDDGETAAPGQPGDHPHLGEHPSGHEGHHPDGDPAPRPTQGQTPGPDGDEDATADGESGNGGEADDGSGDGGDPPFGLPVLSEVPELAMVLEQLVQVDRLLAMALEGIIRLQDHGVSESTTGLPLERWLAAIAKRTGSDRRMLSTAAAACRRLPCLRGAFCDGQISWAQVRSVALKVESLPGYLDDRIDAAIADALSGAAGTDPDGICRLIGWHLQAIEAEHVREASVSGAPEADWLAMQPRLDATGGEVHGDFGAEGFALLDAALNTGPPVKGRTRAGIGADTDRNTAREHARHFARARAERLKQLCRTGTTPGDAGDAGKASHEVLSDIPGNQTLLRADLDTVLDRMPAALLTRLTGGRLHVDAATARRLMDTYGTRLRVVLVDHGRIVGVGRASRQPPGWLADATLAMHDTCSEPGCHVAARVCDLDHAQPWSDRDRPGRTDIDQLAPLCATANHDKERAGWQVTQHPDGVRVWTHRRTGLTTRTVPATWQPPPSGDDDGDGPPGGGDGQPGNGPDRREPGSDPPGGTPPTGEHPPDGDVPTESDPPDRGQPDGGSDPPGSDPPGKADPPADHGSPPARPDDPPGEDTEPEADDIPF